MPIAPAHNERLTPFFAAGQSDNTQTVAPLPHAAPAAQASIADRVAQWADRSYENPVAAPEDQAPVNGVGAAPAGGAAESPRTWRVRSTGALKEEVLADGDRHVAMAMHLSPLAFIWIGPFALAIPLVLWLIRKDQSHFADDHGRETLNFLISFCLLHLVLAVTIIGILAIPALWVVAVVNLIRGAVYASRNEYFRYPLTMRWL